MLSIQCIRNPITRTKPNLSASKFMLTMDFTGLELEPSLIVLITRLLEKKCCHLTDHPVTPRSSHLPKRPRIGLSNCSIHITPIPSWLEWFNPD